MRLPTDEATRNALYRNLVRQCDLASRSDRRARHQHLQNAYERGANITVGTARYNRLDELVDASTSYLYALDALRFALVLPPHYGEAWLDELEIATDEMHRFWHDTDAGLVAEMAVRQAHVDDSVITKVVVSDGEPRPLIVPDPSDVAVIEEYRPWEDQEALVHWYTMGLPAFFRWIRASIPSDTRAEEIWQEAKEWAAPHADAGHGLPPASISNLIVLSTASPTMQGQVQNLSSIPRPYAQSREPVVQLAELWVKDDQARCGRCAKEVLHKGAHGDWRGDYRMVTMMTATERILFEAVNPQLPGEHPFKPLTLRAMPGYCWGRSLLESVLELQAWRERRMTQIDGLLGKQLDPSWALIGFSGNLDEKVKAARQAGGWIANAMPNARVEPLMPQMPPDAFHEIEQIDRMMARAWGLPELLQGEGQPGLRAGNQAGVLATLGSARMRARAMYVEDWLEEVATSLLRLHMQASDVVLKTPRATEFLLASLPADVVARVSSHSSSPLYADELRQMGAFLAQQKALDPEHLIDFMGAPFADVLKRTARRRQEAQAQTQERAIRIKEQEAEAKRLKALK